MFTVANLACGFRSIIISSGAQAYIGEVYYRNLTEAVWLIILAAFLDFLDGLVARLSKTSSRFGVELDSLTDIVSFGVAPAVLLINFDLIPHANMGWILAFIFLMTGCFRLARFNLTAKLEQKVNFVGLPIPSAAILIVSYVLFSIEIWGKIAMEKFFIVLVIATSVLMVSAIEFETMPKFDFTNRRNRLKVIFIILVALAVMINASIAIFPVVLIYIVYSLIKFIIAMFSNGYWRPLKRNDVKT